MLALSSRLSTFFDLDFDFVFLGPVSPFSFDQACCSLVAASFMLSSSVELYRFRVTRYRSISRCNTIESSG